MVRMIKDDIIVREDAAEVSVFLSDLTSIVLGHTDRRLHRQIGAMYGAAVLRASFHAGWPTLGGVPGRTDQVTRRKP